MRSLRLLALGLFALCLGCSSSLKNVRVLADGLSASGELTETAALDLHESCLRGERYGLLRNQLLGVPNAAGLYEQGTLVCGTSVGFGQRYIALHALVVAYGKTLAELTEDEAVSYDAAIAALVKASDGTATAISGVSIDHAIRPGVAEASKNLLAVVSDWAASGYRRAEVKDAIVEGAPHVAVLLGGLHRMLAELYLPMLEVEEQRARSLFQILVKAEPEQVVFADLKWRELSLQFVARRARVHAAIERLSALCVAHDKVAALAKAGDPALEKGLLIPELKLVLSDMLKKGAELETVPWEPPPRSPAVVVPPSPEAPRAPATPAAPAVGWLMESGR